jgi:acetyltransferase
MTTRNFDAIFKPQAIALVGASNQPNTVGAVLARNLLDSGFRGPVMPVNPHQRAIRSTVSYRSVSELPIAPDLAVIATPPPTVPGLVSDLAASGCRAVIVVTAGFGEGERAEGAALRQAMLDAARPHLLRIVGPNCLGFISPAAGINASFAHLTPPAGDLAFVTQSGALATAVLDWAATRGIGFSHVVSLGGMADVDFGDMLDYLALDRATRAVLLYIESVTDARKFMTAGRIAARAKPVIVIKAGRRAAGAKAALSHTGALAGSDTVYDAAFRRAGMLRVYELRELFEAATTLAAGISPAGSRLAILTNGGGAGVLATDTLGDYGAAPVELAPQTIERLNGALPPTWSRGNPVDILGDATGPRYRAGLEALLADPGVDAVLVMNCPTAIADSAEAARAVLDLVKSGQRAPVLTCWLGDAAAQESRRLFTARRVPTYETPGEAVRALFHLVDYKRNQELLLETPPAGPRPEDTDPRAAHALVENVLRDQRSVLTEPEAKELLGHFRIPVVETVVAVDAEDARRKAERLAGAVALKILSRDITHKSDVGGVALDLRTPEAVEAAATDMLKSVRERVPDARIDGFTVQPMVDRRQDHELIAGIADDVSFGRVLLFGQGGVATEVIGDRAIGLPPLNLVLAREMILRTRVSRMLAGFRNRPPADVDAVAATLVKLSELLIRVPEVVELDINPLLAGPNGILALDARVVVAAAGSAGTKRLAIKPYPAHLEHLVEIDSGLKLLVRPIRPEDEPRLVEMVARSAPEDVRLRFLGVLKEFPHLLSARLSQIDYDREMAFVAVDVRPGSSCGEILGVSRMVADPENERAEFAVMVRSDMKGRGLGFQLMKDILACARQRGIRVIYGDVLSENTTMLRMAEELGFTRERAEDGVVRIALALAAGP